MNLWAEISDMEGRCLKTLDRGFKFDMVKVTPSSIIVRPHRTNKERLIPRVEIEGAWKELVAWGHISRTQIEARHAPRNPVYVAAILSELPGVRYTIKPIVVYYTKS